MTWLCLALSVLPRHDLSVSIGLDSWAASLKYAVAVKLDPEHWRFNHRQLTRWSCSL